MRRKTRGQSIVEMAMVLPFLLFLAFAIIDMGWYVYGYGTIYNAARRGAEKASQLPPQKNKLADPTDECAGAVFKAVQDNASMFTGLGTPAYVTIVYPNNGPRKLGEKIQVRVNNFQLYPLTPLMTLGKAFGFGSVDGNGDAVMTISTVSERTIESLGQNPNFPNGMACQP
jgi:Flp pilus assembly protein TadG